MDQTPNTFITSLSRRERKREKRIYQAREVRPRAPSKCISRSETSAGLSRPSRTTISSDRCRRTFVNNLHVLGRISFLEKSHISRKVLDDHEHSNK